MASIKKLSEQVIDVGERMGHVADYAGRWRAAVKAALPQLPLRLGLWEALLNEPVAT